MLLYMYIALLNTVWLSVSAAEKKLQGFHGTRLSINQSVNIDQSVMHTRLTPAAISLVCRESAAETHGNR